MILFYIKDGYSEKGPFTIGELKELKISKVTFVRRADTDSWIQADNFPELKEIFKKDSRVLKIIFVLLVSSAIMLIIIALISNINFKSNSSFSPLRAVVERLPDPPIIDYQVSKHEKYILNEIFKDCNLFGDKNKLVDACNYSNPILRNKAVSIAGKNAGTYNLGQICDIFDYCYNNWKYVNDPKAREIKEYASNTINNGLNGDCDDFAILVCSMILAIGGEARINYAYDANSGHAFTEVNIGITSSEEVKNYISKRYKEVYNDDGIWKRIDKDNNKWLNLDWFAKHPGGKYFNYNNGTTFYIIQQYCEEFTN